MTDQTAVQMNFSLLTDHDIYLFKEGNHFRLYDKLGAHVVTERQRPRHAFRRLGPQCRPRLRRRGLQRVEPANASTGRRAGTARASGRALSPSIGKGTLYKYHIVSNHNGYTVNKGDPLAFFWEMPPNTASVVWDLDYEWGDEAWRQKQPEQQLAQRAVQYLRSPPRLVAARPQRPRPPAQLRRRSRPAGPNTSRRWASRTWSSCRSWSTRSTPRGVIRRWATSLPAAGTAARQDLMFLIDHLHQNGIGVILDWVPSHFPTDEYGLGYFDGTHLYEHADPRLGFHPDWTQRHLQLRPARGPRVPDQFRLLLARQVPRGCPARRWRRLHALSRLLPQGGRMDPERARRAGEPPGHRVPAPPQRDGVPGLPARPDDRRGIHGLAHGDQARSIPAAWASA